MSDTPSETDEVTFHQHKSAQFRVIHSDGVWCSEGPHGNLHLMFFNERWPIPTQTTYVLTGDGELGPEDTTKRQGKPGYFREFEADVVLNLRNAAALHAYLGDYISRAAGNK